MQMEYFQDPQGSVHGFDVSDPAQVALMTELGASAWTNVTGSWPPAPPAAAVAQAALIAALGAGAQVTSTATPALNGTFTTPCALPGAPAINAGAQANISAVSTRIANGLGMPGGGSTFNFYDISGGPHAFNQANWTNFARVMSDYSYALQNWYLSGAQGNPPSNALTIP